MYSSGKNQRQRIGWKYRLRHLFIAVVLVTTGFFLAVSGLQAVTAAMDELGRVEHVVSKRTFTSDGQFVLVLDPAGGMYAVDLHGDRVSTFGVEAGIAALTVFGQSQIFGDRGQIFVDLGVVGKFFDLREGGFYDADIPSGGSGQAFMAGDILWWYHGSLAWYPLDDPRDDIEIVPTPPGSLAPEGFEEVVAVDERGILLQTSNGSEAFLEYWPSGGGLLRYGPMPLRGFPRDLALLAMPKFTLMDRLVVFLEPVTDGFDLVALDRDSFRVMWRHTVGSANHPYVVANRETWLLGDLHILNGTQYVDHSFKFGGDDGQVDGSHSIALHRFIPLSGEPAIPTEEGFLFHEYGQVWHFQPNAGPYLTDVMKMSGGTLVLLFGVAWPIASNKHLSGTAQGGTVRCLNCGSKRDEGITFCKKCGWRTEDEDRAAHKRKEAWEEEW